MGLHRQKKMLSAEKGPLSTRHLIQTSWYTQNRNLEYKHETKKEETEKKSEETTKPKKADRNTRKKKQRRH